MLTLKGLSRSVARRSVTLINSDISTGPAVNTRNSTANGSAKLHPVSARVSRPEPTWPPEEGPDARPPPAPVTAPGAEVADGPGVRSGAVSTAPPGWPWLDAVPGVEPGAVLAATSGR